jgi:hypothetical protein
LGQTTTSSKVKVMAGETLPAASILAIHTPHQSTRVSNVDGRHAKYVLAGPTKLPFPL